jgi:hypothetical protein
MSTAMIAMTTSNSISVNPRSLRLMDGLPEEPMRMKPHIKAMYRKNDHWMQ